jgi:hypothetical protein
MYAIVYSTVCIYCFRARRSINVESFFPCCWLLLSSLLPVTKEEDDVSISLQWGGKKSNVGLYCVVRVAACAVVCVHMFPFRRSTSERTNAGASRQARNGRRESNTCVMFSPPAFPNQREREREREQSLPHSLTHHDRSQMKREHPLGLSIFIRGGEETNKDSLSNGE